MASKKNPHAVLLMQQLKYFHAILHPHMVFFSVVFSVDGGKFPRHILHNCLYGAVAYICSVNCG